MMIDHVVVWRVSKVWTTTVLWCVCVCVGVGGKGGRVGEEGAVLKHVLLCVSMLPEFTTQRHFFSADFGH